MIVFGSKDKLTLVKDTTNAFSVRGHRDEYSMKISGFYFIPIGKYPDSVLRDFRRDQTGF